MHPQHLQLPTGVNTTFDNRTKLTIYVVDRYRNRLLDYDTVSRSLMAAGEAVPVSAMPTLHRGKAAVPGIAVPVLIAGPHQVNFSTDGLMSTALELTVTEGPPAQLVIVQQPHNTTDNRGPLETQPVIELHDAAGNPLMRPMVPPGVSLVARGHLNHPGRNASTWSAPFQGGNFTFHGIQFVAEYGAVYHLRFTLDPSAGMKVNPNLPPFPCSVRACVRACACQQFLLLWRCTSME